MGNELNNGTAIYDITAQTVYLPCGLTALVTSI
jgi:hypothetical protein